MVFSSSTFLFLFLPVILGGYYLLHPRFRNCFLLLASLAFYAFGEPKFVVMMIVSIVINYFGAIIICRCKRIGLRKLCLFVGIFLNLSLLVVFKYMNFITGNLHKMISSVNVTSFVLPIGISFFTFQAMSYLVDVYRGEIAQKNPLNLGLYISFFPQLVAGPIVRYKTIAEEIHTRKESWEDFSDGVVVFLNGLTKKIIFANNLSIVADKAFAGQMDQQSIMFSWLGMIAYSMQIYFDFSGYSDMAIGLGRMFGFHFAQNFNYPYFAKSITDFWRRWHISLSFWFRDYVYIPLGGSKVKGKLLHIRNMFIVWFLTGLWHGANWTFIVWGMAYFILLVFEKYLIKPEQIKKRVLTWIYRCLVFLAVMICWVIFRADNIRAAGQYFKSMMGMYGNPLIDNDFVWYLSEYILLLILALFLATPLVRKAIRFIRGRINGVAFELVKSILYILLFAFCVSYLVVGAHNPFIYFNF